MMFILLCLLNYQLKVPENYFLMFCYTKLFIDSITVQQDAKIVLKLLFGRSMKQNWFTHTQLK
jgi:hypothetical protein